MRDVQNRRGQATLEFALLTPIVILLIGATISFGMFFFQANVLQQAVDVAAQEISRASYGIDQELGLGQLDKCEDLDFVCNDPLFQSKIYDEQYLVIHDEEWDTDTDCNGDFQVFVDKLPLLNRLLVPTMIRDNDMTRYPGTIVRNSSTGEDTVLIPIVEYHEREVDLADPLPFSNDNPPAVGSVPSTICTAGEIVCQWVAPVEEIRVDHDNDDATAVEGPYKLGGYDVSPTLDTFEPGMVALRINYPAQSTTLLNRITVDDDPSDNECPIGNCIVIVGDTELKPDADTGCYNVVTPSDRISPASGKPGSNANAGLYGLGELEALTRVIRPYRKVMSFQAIYRREVFSDGS